MMEPGKGIIGKVVVVYINTGAIFSEQAGWTLDSPRFEEQMGRTFIVGKALTEHQPDPSWHAGATVHIHWESVSHYLVFDSIEEYHEAVHRHRAELPKRGWFGPRSKT